MQLVVKVQLRNFEHNAIPRHTFYLDQNNLIIIYYLMTLETLDMIWRLVTGLYLPDFLPYGRPKGPKIENEASKNIVLSSLRPYMKSRWTT